MDRLSIYYILGILNVMICQTDDCSIGKHETHPCCTNYFLENGECKKCLPGYFGNNCSSRCVYPQYGQHCQKKCDCDVTYCNHEHGCLGNYSENETSTVITWSTITSAGEKTTIYSKNYRKPDNDNSTLAIILVACGFIMLFVVTGVPWISKLVRLHCTSFVQADDNDRIETVYMEINAGSEQQDPQSNTMGATVITRSCTSLDGLEMRPELPAKNNLDQRARPAHANEDNGPHISSK